MFKNIVRFSLVIATLFCVVVPAFAWDETGHKLTAYIAWQHMTPEVRERVVDILRSAPEDSQIGAFYMSNNSRTTESKRREFFMMIATWPDIIRDKSFETRYKKYANSNWHYADTFWMWKDGKAVLVDSNDANGLAMQKMMDFNQVIRGSASDADKAIAIAWLEHLIGDIHQPLHTSGKVTDSNPKGDQGGNLFLLTPKGTPRDKQENLHWFWDSIVGRYQPNTKDQCDSDYIDPIGNEIIRLYPYDKLKGQINDDKFDLWAKESLDIAMTDIYKDVKFFETPSDKYKKMAFEIAQRRLALAGYRMADLFNEVFSTTNSAPATAVPTTK
ncbi:MAG: S1/P1 nuclease [Acidobacteriota bacterium]